MEVIHSPGREACSVKVRSENRARTGFSRTAVVTVEGAVEKVFGIDYQWAPEDAFDAVEVEGAEFRPAGTEDESVGAFGNGISRITVANISVEFLLRVRHGDGIVGADLGAALHQRTHQADSAGAGHRIRVGLERQSQHPDLLALHRLHNVVDLLHDAVAELLVYFARGGQDLERDTGSL